MNLNATETPPLPRRIYKLERYEDQHGRCLIARTQVPEQFPAVVVYTGTCNPKPLNGATFSFNINAISLEEAFKIITPNGIIIRCNGFEVLEQCVRRVMVEQKCVFEALWITEIK